MRSLLIILACVGVFAAGFYLAVAGASHPFDVMRAWTAGSTLYAVATPASSATTAPAAQSSAEQQYRGSIPPQEIPSHPNWTWYLPDGRTFQNVVITNLTTHDVTISHAKGIAHLTVDSLPPDVQRELQYTPGSNNGAAPGGLTQVAALIDKKLVDATGQAVPTPGAGVKYYAIYYSASWCPPCHAFTPDLVNWYRTFKPQHSNFELIFVSEDRSEQAMFGYMTEMQMPWPAVKYSELPRTDGTFRGPGIQQFANDGIPDLVLVDSSGHVLADSFNGSDYVGPDSVVEYMSANIRN